MVPQSSLANGDTSLPEGVLLVLTAPLGVGKRTLCQALIDRHPELRLSVSTTTRPPGPREVDGYDFHFTSQEDFERHVAAGDFLEHVKINGHYFGTPLPPILENISTGQDVLLDVDTRGAHAVKEKRPDAALVFICPSTMEIVAARVMSMDPSGKDYFSSRMERVRGEIAQAASFDYVILNDSLVETADEISMLLRAERQRARRAAPLLTKLVNTIPSLPPSL